MEVRWKRIVGRASGVLAWELHDVRAGVKRGCGTHVREQSDHHGQLLQWPSRSTEYHVREKRESASSQKAQSYFGSRRVVFTRAGRLSHVFRGLQLP